MSGTIADEGGTSASDPRVQRPLPGRIESRHGVTLCPLTPLALGEVSLTSVRFCVVPEPTNT
jgi:hypothetical protein